MSSDVLKSETLEELTEYFRKLDLDGDGKFTATELGKAFEICGETLPGYALRDMISQYDIDRNGSLDLSEFIKMFTSHSEKKRNKFRDMIKRRDGVDSFGTTSVHANQDTKHSITDHEQQSFSDWINSVLKDDADCRKYLPIRVDGDDLFQKCSDGVLLCKLINKSVPNTIDERVINKGKLSKFTITENNNLAINSAASIGCSVVNIGHADIAAGSKHIILGLLWQVIKLGLLSTVNLKSHAELAALLRDGETLEGLMRLSPEELLMRWVNYHMEKAGCPRRVRNFGNDIADSEVYAYLLTQIRPPHMSGEGFHSAQSIISNPDHLRRATLVLQNADQLGQRHFVSARDITSGNAKLNLAFVANLFNAYPTLEVAADFEPIEVVEETREEKMYRNWMNSLGADPYINHLYSDLRNGLVLFQIYRIIKPGCVDEKRVNKTFTGSQGRFRQIENCNYAVELGHGMRFSLVGIGGEDIYNMNETLTMALLWQMLRAYTLKVLESLSSGGIKDAQIVQWVNSTLERIGKATRISGFKDRQITTSHVILDVIDAIRPGVIRADLVQDGTTPESKLDNAKYAISCCRKAGAKVYALPEDVVDGVPKMILTIFACLMTLERDLQK